MPHQIRVSVGPRNPSGVAMPNGNLAPDAQAASGWVQIVAEDFDTDCAEGSFLSTYPKWDAYPTEYIDTSGVGTYDPGILSVSASKLRMRLHTNGSNSVRVAAPYPRATFPLNYGRVDVCFRADPLPRYKTAWMLWPTDDVWPGHGEIDWPEGALDGEMSAFMHRMDGVDGSDQDAYDTSYRAQNWHVATTIWAPSYCRFLMDGSVVGTSTSRVPSVPMRWVLQTETNTSGLVPDPAVAGFVDIDWAVAYRIGP